jgi:bacterioferritin (cytochrome b1)
MTEALATDEQRWQIFDLFGHFGIKEVAQVRADAARILKLDYLPDLREITSADADELIAELRRALAAERVGND